MLFLVYKLGRTILMTAGVIPNPYMSGAILERVAPIMPTSKGDQSTPAGEGICAIMLAARCNHPLGLFAPGFKEVGDYMQRMQKQLSDEATPNGFLGSNAWMSNNDPYEPSETMLFM